MRRSIFAVILVATACVSVGVAAASAAPRPANTAADPWERLNRRGYAINQFLDRVLIRPAAMLYRALTPGPIGKGLHNAVTNLGEPLVFINDVLQLRFKKAASATVRFVFNSTLGLGGLIDVVGRDGIPHHPSTFGDTLGRYGVGPGPYLFIPVLGPSTVRDLLGGGVDTAADPIHWAIYPYRTAIGVGSAVAGGLDTRAAAEEQLNAILGDAADPYATLRSVYLQYRQSEIDDARGAPSLPPLPEIDDSAAPADPSLPPPEEISPKPGMGVSPSAATQVPAPSTASRSFSSNGGGEVVVQPAFEQAVAFERLPDQ